MLRVASFLVLLTLSGCSWAWDDIGGSGQRTIWQPSPPRPWMPLPPDHPMRVWIGVPEAVLLTAAPPEGSWPEYEPLTLPSAGAIWVAEHWDWDWDGPEGWVWMRGRWIEPPGPGYEWNPPTWNRDERGTYFIAGFFCGPPPPVECGTCQRRPELTRARMACRKGLDQETKRALAWQRAPRNPSNAEVAANAR